MFVPGLYLAKVLISVARSCRADSEFLVRPGMTCVFVRPDVRFTVQVMRPLCCFLAGMRPRTVPGVWSRGARAVRGWGRAVCFRLCAIAMLRLREPFVLSWDI